MSFMGSADSTALPGCLLISHFIIIIAWTTPVIRALHYSITFTIVVATKSVTCTVTITCTILVTRTAVTSTIAAFNRFERYLVKRFFVENL